MNELKYKTEVTFRGYVTTDLQAAIERYNETVGEEPRLAVVRPDLELEAEDDSIVVRDKHGCARVILLTHLVEVDQWHLLQFSENEKIWTVASAVMKENEERRQRRRDHKLYEEQMRLAVEKAKQVRRKKETGKCPVCKRQIRGSRFEKLGYWPGWQFGIEPDYWPALRLYVFRRDGYQCQICAKSYTDMSKLRAHHLTPKEQGGTDSAKNLITHCYQCHPDEQPLYPLEAELEREIEKIIG